MTVVFELPFERHTTCSIVIIICYILYIYIPTLSGGVRCNGKTTLGIYTLVGSRLLVFVIIIIMCVEREINMQMDRTVNHRRAFNIITFTVT